MATAERILERKFHLEKQQAHAVAATAKKNLGLPKNVMFSKKLIDECQRVAEEKGYLKDGKRVGYQTGFVFRAIGEPSKRTHDATETRSTASSENDSEDITPTKPPDATASAESSQELIKDATIAEEPSPEKEHAEDPASNSNTEKESDTAMLKTIIETGQPSEAGNENPVPAKLESPKDVKFSDDSEESPSHKEKSSKQKSSKSKSKDELSSSKHKSNKDDLSSSKHKSKDSLSSSKHKSLKDPLSSSKHKGSDSKQKDETSRGRDKSAAKQRPKKERAKSKDIRGKTSKTDSSSVKSSSSHNKDPVKDKESTKENNEPAEKEKKKKPIQLFDGLILDGPLPILSDNAKPHRTTFKPRHHSDDESLIDAKGSQARMKRRNRPRRASIGGIATCRWDSSPSATSNANVAMAAVSSSGGDEGSRWRTDQQRINQNMAEQKHIRPQQQTLQIPTRSSDDEDSQTEANRSSSLPLLKPHRRGSIE